MTEAEKTELAKIWADYQTAKKNYDIETGDNYNFRQSWITVSNGGTVGWRNAEQWYEMVQASDASLKVKKAIMETTLSDYNALYKKLSDADAAAFQAANPGIALQIQQANIEATKDLKAQEIAAKTDMTKANYASDNTKYIVAGIVVLLVIATVAFFYFRKKTVSA